MHQIANGAFEINMTFTDATVPNIGQATFDKVWQGDLIGNSQGHFLSFRTSEEGSAAYVVIETFEGELKGKRGSFAFAQFGTMYRGEQQLTYAIIADSGTDELKGIRGHLTLGEDHQYQLSYELTT